jgi:hypothetical protein
MTLFLPLASSMKRSEECPDVKSVGVVDEMMREAYSPPSLYLILTDLICLHVSLPLQFPHILRFVCASIGLSMP